MIMQLRYTILAAAFVSQSVARRGIARFNWLTAEVLTRQARQTDPSRNDRPCHITQGSE